MAKELLDLSNVSNLIPTVVSTASIVSAVMGTYYRLVGMLKDERAERTAEKRVNELRMSTIEAQLSLLRSEVDHLKRIIYEDKNHN